MFDGSSHSIYGVDSANDYRIFKRASIVTNTHRLEVRDDGEILPNLLVEASIVEFFAKDSIGFAHSFEAFASDSAEATHAKTRTREWLTINHVVRQAKFDTASANFVLEELLERFNEAKLKVFRKSANIVVRLHHLGSLSSTFHDVGVDGALTQEFDAIEFASFFFENAYELAADDFALLFRVGNSSKLAEEAFGSINVDKVGVKLIAEHFDNVFRFTLTHKTMVNMNANKVVADSLEQERSHYRAVNATRESQKHLLVAHLTANQLDLVVDEVSHVPVSLSLASIENEAFNGILDSLFIIGELRKFNVAKRLVVASSHDREASLIDFVVNIDSNAVDYVVRATVDDDTFHVRQCLEFVSSDVVRIDFTVNAKSSNSASQDGVFVTTQV